MEELKEILKEVLAAYLEASTKKPTKKDAQARVQQWTQRAKLNGEQKTLDDVRTNDAFEAAPIVLHIKYAPDISSTAREIAKIIMGKDADSEANEVLKFYLATTALGNMFKTALESCGVPLEVSVQDLREATFSQSEMATIEEKTKGKRNMTCYDLQGGNRGAMCERCLLLGHSWPGATPIDGFDINVPPVCMFCGFNGSNELPV